MDKTWTALVTGASSGIGCELAKVLAAEGHDLILVARGKETLERLASELHAKHKVKVDVIAHDLSQPRAGHTLYEKLQNANLEVDILVNNAGLGTLGPMSSTPWPDLETLIALNITVLTELTRLLLPSMLARGNGHILNVASTAAFQPGPLMAVYYASKSYVLSLSQALGHELRGSGVKVTALCPGITRTNFINKAKIEHSKLANGVLTPVMQPADVAAMAYDAMKRGKKVIVPGWINKMSVWSVPFMPMPLKLWLVEYLHAE